MYSFGADVIGFSARGRHGLTEEVELQAEAAVVHFDDSEAADTDQTPYMGSARVGTKWSIGALGHHLALTAGLGGGAHAGGGFTAADLGFVAGFQNRYVVPFYAMEGGVSLPIAASAVDTSREDEDPGTHTDTPLTTFSVRTTMGLRVPFTLGWDAPGAFAVGVQHVLLVGHRGGERRLVRAGGAVRSGVLRGRSRSAPAWYLRVGSCRTWPHIATHLVPQPQRLNASSSAISRPFAVAKGCRDQGEKSKFPAIWRSIEGGGHPIGRYPEARP
jgi:hypothetical protein